MIIKWYLIKSDIVTLNLSNGQNLIVEVASIIYRSNYAKSGLPIIIVANKRYSSVSIRPTLLAREISDASLLGWLVSVRTTVEKRRATTRFKVIVEHLKSKFRRIFRSRESKLRKARKIMPITIHVHTIHVLQGISKEISLFTFTFYNVSRNILRNVVAR